MEITPFGRVTLVIAVQPAKALSAITVTPAGIFTFPLAVAPVMRQWLRITSGFFFCWVFSHFVPWKAKAPMEVIVFGMVIVFKLVQPEKAKSSMEVTAFGMVTLFRLVQPAKALSPIAVTPFGIVTLVFFPE